MFSKLKNAVKNNIVISTFVHIRALLGRKHKKRGILLIVLVLMSSALEVFGLASIYPFLKITLDKEFVKTNEYVVAFYDFIGFTSYEQFIIASAVLLLVVFALKNLMIIGIKFWQTKYAFSVTTDICRRQFQTAFRRDYHFFKNTNSKAIMRDITNIPQRFAKQVLLGFINFTTEMTVLLLIVTAICIYQPLLFIGLVILLGGTFIGIYSATKKKVYRLGVELKDKQPIMNNILYESAVGYIDIKLGNVVNYFRKKYMKYQKTLHNISVWKTFYQLLPNKLTEVVAVTGIVLIFLYGVTFAQDTKDILLFLGIFAVATYRVIPSINRMLIAVIGIKNNWIAVEILSEFNKISTKEKQQGKIKFDKQIDFKKVDFKFPDADGWLFNKLHFTIRKSERIGIIGRTGSGKSTILKMLLGLYYPDNGKILVDGKPITKRNIDNWRDKVGYVQQDIFLIDGSLKENIAFGIPQSEIDEQKLEEAVYYADLKQFVENLPQGLDTPVGELGAKISGGQKQRLGIARALYRNAELFVFDEATSALDPATEESILKAVDQLADKGKTIFIVAHRITTLRGCNRILELKDGRIVDTHQYEQLIEKISA